MTVLETVVKAILQLKDSKGSSRQAIKKTYAEITGKKVEDVANHLLRAAIKKGLDSGVLVKGKTDSLFKVDKTKLPKPKPAKKKVAKKVAPKKKAPKKKAAAKKPAAKKPAAKKAAAKKPAAKKTAKKPAAKKPAAKKPAAKKAAKAKPAAKKKTAAKKWMLSLSSSTSFKRLSS